MGGAGDFLIGTGNNEIRAIHRDKISCVLAVKMVLSLILLPVQSRMKIFALFQRMRDIALSYPHPFRNQGRYQIAIRVIADNEIGAAAQLRQRFTFDVVGEIFKVGPDLETGYPMSNNFSIFFSKRYAYDPRILGTMNFLQRLVT